MCCLFEILVYTCNKQIGGECKEKKEKSVGNVVCNLLSEGLMMPFRVKTGT